MRKVLLYLLLAELLVGVLVEEAVELRLVGHLHLDEPTVAHGVSVNELRVLNNALVDLKNLAGDRGVHIRCCLNGLNGAEGVTLVEGVTNLHVKTYHHKHINPTDAGQPIKTTISMCSTRSTDRMNTYSHAPFHEEQHIALKDFSRKAVRVSHSCT